MSLLLLPAGYEPYACPARGAAEAAWQADCDTTLGGDAAVEEARFNAFLRALRGVHTVPSQLATFSVQLVEALTAPATDDAGAALIASIARPASEADARSFSI